MDLVTTLLRLMPVWRLAVRYRRSLTFSELVSEEHRRALEIETPEQAERPDQGRAEEERQGERWRKASSFPDNVLTSSSDTCWQVSKTADNFNIKRHSAY